MDISETLKQGVVAHQDGKLQEAERLYKVVLSSQPKHPKANHNLGVLAVSVGKIELALPYFKTALESKPKQDQFWLSYITALIQLERFDDAKTILNKAKEIE